MPDGKRLWRTGAGDLVEDGHPDAVTLAYGSGDALADGDRARVAKAAGHTPKRAAVPTAKRSDK